MPAVTSSPTMTWSWSWTYWRHSLRDETSGPRLLGSLVDPRRRGVDATLIRRNARVAVLLDAVIVAE